MANKIEYIFSLRDQISAKLAGITATSEKTRSALSGVQEKVRSAEDVFQDTGKTIGSLKARIDALQAEKEWIPADNLPAIKEYNREISRLTNELNELETAAGGGKFKKMGIGSLRRDTRCKPSEKSISCGHNRRHLCRKCRHDL